MTLSRLFCIPVWNKTVTLELEWVLCSFLYNQLVPAKRWALGPILGLYLVSKCVYLEGFQHLEVEQSAMEGEADYLSFQNDFGFLEPSLMLPEIIKWEIAFFVSCFSCYETNYSFIGLTAGERFP
jgi:hypothetical protein